MEDQTKPVYTKNRYTRTHYEELAAMVKDLNDKAVMPKALALRLAELFAVDNPRFDAVRFFEACGVTA